MATSLPALASQGQSQGPPGPAEPPRPPGRDDHDGCDGQEAGHLDNLPPPPPPPPGTMDYTLPTPEETIIEIKKRLPSLSMDSKGNVEIGSILTSVLQGFFDTHLGFKVSVASCAANLYNKLHLEPLEEEVKAHMELLFTRVKEIAIPSESMEDEVLFHTLPFVRLIDEVVEITCQEKKFSGRLKPSHELGMKDMFAIRLQTPEGPIRHYVPLSSLLTGQVIVQKVEKEHNKEDITVAN